MHTSLLIHPMWGKWGPHTPPITTVSLMTQHYPAEPKITFALTILQTLCIRSALKQQAGRGTTGKFFFVSGCFYWSQMTGHVLCTSDNADSHIHMLHCIRKNGNRKHTIFQYLLSQYWTGSRWDQLDITMTAHLALISWREILAKGLVPVNSNSW